VADEIAEGIKEKTDFHIVVIRSTVLPGTNEKVKRIIEEKTDRVSDREFAVVSNPEFLREGSAIEDFKNPAYTLVGTSCLRAIEKLKEMYKEIEAPFISTEVKNAEIIKYVNNAYHAHKIIFANEIGNICKHIGIDSHEMMKIFCLDKKLNISPYYLKPGFAYGGSCLPKDLKALRAIAHDNYIECPVLENIERSNEIQKRNVLERIIEFGKEKIGFLGLSFKGGTDDLRNSPIIDIIEPLMGKGFDIRIYDRNLRISELLGANKEYILKKIPFISKYIVAEQDEIIGHSEVIVVVNKEKEFESILEKLDKETMVFDLVNIDFKGRKERDNYTGVAW
jgi:GDP-mannose 6-dehydrogenase